MTTKKKAPVKKKLDVMARLRFIVDTETIGRQPRDRIMRAVRALLRERAQLAVEACALAVPRAHTYASENADVYLAGDAACERCKNAVRAALGEKP